MARTQLTLAQVTGSAIDIKNEAIQYLEPVTAAALTGSDLQDIVGALAAAVQRIHGKASNEVFNSDEGQFAPAIFDVDTAGAFTVDAGAASEVKTTDGALTIDGKTGVIIQENNTTIFSVDDDRDVNIASARNIDFDSSGAITIDSSAGAISLDGVGNSNFTTLGGSLVLSGANGVSVQGGDGEIDITAPQGLIDINATAGAIDIDAATGITIDTADGDVSITADGADNKVVIKGDHTGGTAIHLDANENANSVVDIDAGALDIDSATVTIDTTATFSIDGVGASNVTTVGALTVSGSSGLNLKADSGTIDIETRTGAIDIDAAAAVTIDTTDTSNGIKFGVATSGVPITIGHTTSETTVADNLNVTGNAVVTGDLIVQGATTTVSSSNLVVQDSIIGLGVSGSAATLNFNNVGDRAIIFARGANSYSSLPALSYDGSEFELATFNASPTSQSMGAAVAGVPLRTGHLKPISDDGATLGDANERWSDLFLAEGAVINFDNGDFTMTQTNNLLALAGGNTRVDKLEIDSANDHIDVNPSLGMAITSQQSLTASVGANFLLDAAGDILLDADGGDIEFLDGGTSLLKITNSSTDVVLQPQASNKDIIFKEDGGNEIARFDSSEESLLFPTLKELQFAGSAGKIFGIDDGEIVIDGGVKVEVTGSLVALYSETKGDNIRIRAGNVDTGVDIDAGNTASGSFNAGYIQITGSQRTDIGSAATLNIGGQTALDMTTGGRFSLKAAQDDVDAILLDASTGAGGGIQLKGGDQNDSVEIIQSPILFNNITHPTVAVKKLYAFNDQLHHDGLVILSGSSSSRSKILTTITSSVPSGSALDVTGFDFGGPNNNTLVDVFVNGQLMASGGALDYRGEGSLTTTISFTFGLEEDDVVVFTKSPM
jgi:uncharacterized protein (DUF2345 family)